MEGTDKVSFGENTASMQHSKTLTLAETCYSAFD